MQKPAAILFDLDGTLADTAPDFIDVVNSLRQDDDLPPLTDDAIRQQVSNGGLALACLTWNVASDDPQAWPLRQRLLDRYEQLIGQRAVAFGLVAFQPVQLDRDDAVKDLVQPHGQLGAQVADLAGAAANDAIDLVADEEEDLDQYPSSMIDNGEASVSGSGEEDV